MIFICWMHSAESLSPNNMRNKMPGMLHWPASSSWFAETTTSLSAVSERYYIPGTKMQFSLPLPPREHLYCLAFLLPPIRSFKKHFRPALSSPFTMTFGKLCFPVHIWGCLFKKTCHLFLRRRSDADNLLRKPQGFMTRLVTWGKVSWRRLWDPGKTTATSFN